MDILHIMIKTKSKVINITGYQPQGKVLWRYYLYFVINLHKSFIQMIEARTKKTQVNNYLYVYALNIFVCSFHTFPLCFFLSLMELMFCRSLYRGRGGGRGRHSVRLRGLWRTEHYAHWCRPLLLQHGQSLAMTVVTFLMSRRGEKHSKNKPMEKNVTVQLNTFFKWSNLWHSLFKLCQTTR